MTQLPATTSRSRPGRGGRLLTLWAALALAGAPHAFAQGPSEPVAPNSVDDVRLAAIRAELATLQAAMERLESQLAAAQGPAERHADDGLAALDQKVRVIDRKLEIEQEQAAERTKTAPTVTAGREGFALRSGDGQFQLRVRGYMQSDGRFFPGGGADGPAPLTTLGFVMRRVRPVFEGTVFKAFDFRIMPDFGGGTATLQDAYIDLRFAPALKVRAGKFKSPVGLERLVSATETAFVERALPTAVAPNRDLGVVVFGDVLGSRLSYTAGVSNGVVDGASGDGDDRDGKDFVARLFAHPFRTGGPERLKQLGLGVAGTVGTQRGALLSPNLPVYRTAGQVVFARYRLDTTLDGTSFADGDHWRVSPQGYYYSGPFGVLGEYILSAQQVRRGPDAATLDTRAWQVALSYVVTGEDSTYRGVTPRKAFDPSNGAWGGLELTARVNALALDRDAFPTYANPAAAARSATAWGVGANWFLNRALKLTLDFEETRFDGGSPSGDRATEHALLSRLQIGY